MTDPTLESKNGKIVILEPGRSQRRRNFTPFTFDKVFHETPNLFFLYILGLSQTVYHRELFVIDNYFIKGNDKEHLS